MSRMASSRSLYDAWLDLMVGSRCLGCERPGSLACTSCLQQFPNAARLVRPKPCPAGLADCFSTTTYGGMAQEMILWHKERRALRLQRPLGQLLSISVATLLERRQVVSEVRVVLVAAPSNPAVVRARGHDPVAAICRRAAVRLRASGHPVQVVPLLRQRFRILDQSGLTASQRQANLCDSIAVSQVSLSALSRMTTPITCVVCDDILTTGATARECQRALEDAGLPVLGIATVADTVKRGPQDSASRLPF